MKFQDYWALLPTKEKQAFADQAKSDVIYLYHVAAGRKKPSAKLSVRIEAVSSGVVSRFDLRPDANEIWPREAA